MRASDSIEYEHCPLFEEPATIGLRAWRPVYGAVESLSFHQVGFGFVVFYLGILWYPIMENQMEKNMENGNWCYIGFILGM